MKVLMAGIVIMAVLAGCSEQYGQPMSGDLPRITAMQALTDRSFLNRTVVLEGTILTQCQASGCWFFLEDKTGRILVNLAPSNFTLPVSRVGRKVLVKGIVSETEGGITIVGKEVTVH